MTIETVIDEGLNAGYSFDMMAESIERNILVRTLERYAGNQCKAARALKLHRNTLSRKARVLGINFNEIRRLHGDRKNKSRRSSRTGTGA